jgi:AcrR family transcriptional regulator
MTEATTESQERYHHGDLRRQLLEAARCYVEQHGHASLSIRALAQSLGVSSGAPYRHFATREALIVELVIESFHKLNDLTMAAIAEEASPMQRIADLGRFFLQFCVDHPKMFCLMFDPEIVPLSEPRLLAEQREGIRIWTSAFKDAMPGLNENEIYAHHMSFWSTIYGAARLRNQSMMPVDLVGHVDWTEVERLALKAAADSLSIAEGSCRLVCRE